MTATNPSIPSTEQARAELVSTLNAIEDKLNVPRKVSRAVARGKVSFARLKRENPTALVAGIGAVAVAAGAAAWAITRAIVNR